MMPVPGRIGASAAADVEDAPEFAPDPVQEVRSIVGVVVGGFRDHHDGSLLADRRLPRWHRVLTQGPTVPRRSARYGRALREDTVPAGQSSIGQKGPVVVIPKAADYYACLLYTS